MKRSSIFYLLLTATMSGPAMSEVYLCQSSVYSQIDVSGKYKAGAVSITWIIDTEYGFKKIEDSVYGGECNLDLGRFWHCENTKTNFSEDPEFKGFGITERNSEELEKFSIDKLTMGFTYIDSYYGSIALSFAGICSEP
jgi:hypothetical protein